MSRDNDRDLSDDLNGPYVQACCVDCGVDVVTDCDPEGALCDECDEKREQWAVQTEVRMAKATLEKPTNKISGDLHTGIVDVAIVPVSEQHGVVTVALVPVSAGDQAWLKRMATAVLAADLTTIKDVA